MCTDRNVCRNECEQSRTRSVTTNWATSVSGPHNVSVPPSLPPQTWRTEGEHERPLDTRQPKTKPLEDEPRAMPELDATVSVIEYIQGVQESPARTKKKKVRLAE